MNILLATYWEYPHVGGLCTYMDNLRIGLEKWGHRVDVLARTPDVTGYYLAGRRRVLKKSKVLQLIRPRVKAFYKMYGGWCSDWALSQEVERYALEAAYAYFGISGYDLLHAQDIISARALARIKPTDLPLVTTLHGCYTTEFQRAGVLSPADSRSWKYSIRQEKLGVASSDRVIFPSRWLMEELRRNFGQLSSDRLQSIPYGMDIHSFRQRMESPVSVPTAPGATVFLCPARLTPVKGHAVLLNALGILARERTDWQCWFAGGGELMDKLKKRSNSLGISDRTVFLGARSDVPALMKQCDIVVLPSLQDNLPFAVLEAQLAGKPIIASDTGGIPEMITHGVTGLLHPSGDSQALCDQLRLLLDDKTLRDRLGQQAAIWGESEWSMDTMLFRTVTVYEQLMESKGRKAL